MVEGLVKKVNIRKKWVEKELNKRRKKEVESRQTKLDSFEGDDVSVQVGKCPFYCNTSDGHRCVLLPLEEWKKVRKRFENFCNSYFENCEVFKTKYLRFFK